MSNASSPLRTVWRPSRPVDLVRTLGGLGRGRFDPCLRRENSGAIWRASRTPYGPSSTRFSQSAEGVTIESYGTGAEWAIANAPELLGAKDDPTGFEPKGKLAELERRHPGIRITRTKAVFEATLRAVCEQLVTGREARKSFDRIVYKFGERAPGPLELWVPPAPEVLAKAAYWEVRPMGVEMKRANTLRAIGRSAKAIEQTSDMVMADAYKRLLFVDGIGPWTAAEVAVIAWGDADAVSVGDYHLKDLITYAFTGEARGTDARMLELLEPFRPHRARVIKLLHAAHIQPPRFGPRRPIRDF